ncbi:unnamed protein product [Plutella xylostella]|uniref:(diamondback moth) hypothetical protein n=1 Tax=Plutella xylostella TaxID=51655 RepID=A0A8S4G176_PLUXY|nr:unnamed protein product [Plutella xylostella]
MEDVYSIKVKTKPDMRNVYPSERRYSASTVSGLAWVHIALAATSFLLACLALVNPNNQEIKLTLEDSKPLDTNQFLNATEETTTEYISEDNATEKVIDSINKETYGHILVIAPSLLTVFALAAGLAAIMASVRWYIDRNITWLFIMSVLSTVFSLISFIMIAAWFVNTSEGTDDITEFYKDQVPFKDVILIKHTDVIDRNESHIVIARNATDKPEVTSHLFTKRVLSINILIAAFLELLWSILSVKISYKGMRSQYKDDDTERRGNCVSVVTKIKGNTNLRNGKLLPPKPDLIDHYPSKKIKRIFLANGSNGFYLKHQGAGDKNAKQNTETSSEIYKERMMNFLNRCASLEGISEPEIAASVHSDPALNTIPEVTVTNVEINTMENAEINNRMTPVSWGDSPDHMVYNQNNINFDRIFKFGGKKIQDGAEAKESEIQPSEDCRENNLQNK